MDITRKRLVVVVIGVLLLWSAVPAFCQTGYVTTQDPDSPRFIFDFAAFRSDVDEDMVTLEIYYKIYNDGLQFFKQDGKFVANYEFNVVVLGVDKNQVTGFSRQRKHTLDTYAQTTSAGGYLINQIELLVPKGEFKVVCKLIDELSGKVASMEKDVRVEDLFRNEISMSDIEFVHSIEEQADEESGFDKGEKRIVPFVSRSFSGDADNVSFYAELYCDKADPTDVSIQYKVVDEKAKVAYKDKLDLTLESQITRLIKVVSTENLVPGRYELSFELKDSHKRTLVNRKTTFTVAWSMKALIRNDFSAAVEQLRYIASKDETDKLKKADPEAREQVFEDFWRDHDKYPETPENETRSLYYGRIRHANENFSVVNQQGWETDRGRIYIIFGEPDNVERYPFELTSVPYQVWYYYRLSRTFVFEDTHHTGDYYLKFPYDGRRGGLHENFEDFD
ncbi:MAG: GWxTD domain-containing protein [candidate division Zixibacteria bacterium]|nr:GWxTD domain-containing protein [candidate division Zixibacteria bacterium]MBU1472147.1 GWxTD domain-containing protein [candidate division Zixibacteria bacterium]MBU2625658.1 GWxTD domain-containing protein [candidate division Zixibacteria bacterium]